MHDDVTGSSDLIDVSMVSLRDLDDLERSCLADALLWVMTHSDTEPVRGFQSSL